MRRSLNLLVLPAVVAALGSCGGDDDANSGATGSTVSGAVSGAVTVFAAASLTESFTKIGEAFMAANPDIEVVFNFASSSDLVTQIIEGAPADVFASADQHNMQKLVDADGTDDEPTVFARNSLTIVVEPGNPEAIDGLDDLEDPDLIIVTCDPEVPIGAYAAEVFANAGLAVEADSFEEDVKAVLNKVVLGEADAGIVYATDVQAAGDTAEGVEIPEDVNVTARYPLAVTAEAGDPDGAEAFSAFVLSDAGQSILTDDGFSAP